MDFSLRCEAELIPMIASRYSYRQSDAKVEQIGMSVKSRGFMTKPEFLGLCSWKTQRSKSKYSRNSETLVEEATHLAFSATAEELRIGIPMLLNGVDRATASVILHFCHSGRYPIVDFRALWTVGLDEMPRVTFSFWQAYTLYCRSLADRLGISMRLLDRGLWQYSKENQRNHAP